MNILLALCRLLMRALKDCGSRCLAWWGATYFWLAQNRRSLPSHGGGAGGWAVPCHGAAT